MKKAFFTIFLLFISGIVIIGFSTNYVRYKDWKEVEIEDCGTIKIPKEWVMTEYDGRLYLSDKPLDEEDCTVYFVQSHSYPTSASIAAGSDEGAVDTNLFSREVQMLKSERSSVISNGAIYGEELYSVDGVEEKKLYLELSNLHYHTRVYLITWDESIDEDMLIKIAKSFVETRIEN